MSAYVHGNSCLVAFADTNWNQTEYTLLYNGCVICWAGKYNTIQWIYKIDLQNGCMEVCIDMV